MPANPLGIALRNRRAGRHTLAWADDALRGPEKAAGFTLSRLVAAVTGHVPGRARLDGTYENR